MAQVATLFRCMECHHSSRCMEYHHRGVGGNTLQVHRVPSQWRRWQRSSGAWSAITVAQVATLQGHGVPSTWRRWQHSSGAWSAITVAQVATLVRCMECRHRSAGGNISARAVKSYKMEQMQTKICPTLAHARGSNSYCVPRCKPANDILATAVKRENQNASCAAHCRNGDIGDVVIHTHSTSTISYQIDNRIYRIHVEKI